MTGQTHLAIAYLGMIAALAFWTWTVFSRSSRLEASIESLERALVTDEE